MSRAWTTTKTSVSPAASLWSRKPIDQGLIRSEQRYDKALDGRHALTDSTQSHQFTGGTDVIVTFYQQSNLTNQPMLDLIYLLVTIGFFLGSIAYAHWCGKI